MLDEGPMVSALRAKQVRKKRVKRRPALPAALVSLDGQCLLKTPKLLEDMKRKTLYAQNIAAYKASVRYDIQKDEEREALKANLIIQAGGIL